MTCWPLLERFSEARQGRVAVARPAPANDGDDAAADRIEPGALDVAGLAEQMGVPSDAKRSVPSWLRPSLWAAPQVSLT